MSASPEKKAQARAERNEKRRREEQKDRRSMMLYTVVAVVVVVAAVALMFWQSGLLQRSLTAVEINGVKYTAADVQYYYTGAYSQQAQYYAFDTNTSVKKQVYDEATGQSWYDHLMDLAIENLTSVTALAQQARDEGYTLSADAQASLDAYLAQLDTGWISSGASSRSAFIRANFGSSMTYSKLTDLINMEYLASDYASAKLDAAEHSDADFQAYYKEHANELDTVTYTYFTFQAQVPATDDDGNTIEMTDEERTAALEELKTTRKALADELKAKLEDGEDPEQLAEDYADDLYSHAVSTTQTGASLSLYTAFGEWLLEDGRKAGDVELSERDADTAYYYYVVVYESRELVEEETHNVRHILIKAGDGADTPTQAEYDEAEKEAQAILNEWKAGEATEESFTALVAANTQDTASASTGGLYSNITSASNYVEPFLDWAIDPARKEGDTGLVKTEYGWHIMYYVSTNDPVWKQSAASAFQQEDYDKLVEDATQGWNAVRGIGMNFIEA